MTSPNSSPTSVYRPDVDGLRAIAVVSVVLYHYAGFPQGGFTGVDVFFVISGYLITGILRREIEAGKFSLLDFYDRRIRRILPALLAMLIACLVAGWFILLPGDLAKLGSSTAYASVGFGNFFFFANTGYFDQAADLQPLLHTWSLGVEEQFYLVWPIILWAAIKVLRSKLLFKFCFVIALIGGFYIATTTLAADPKSAFYLPLPRAWELAIGALVAFLPPLKNKIGSEFASAAGLILICASFLTLNSRMSFPGAAALLACAGTALLLHDKRETFVGKILALHPMVWIGLISYSLYLWHWPILVIYRHYNSGNLPNQSEICILIVASLAIGYLSYRFIERPFRRPKPHQFKTVGMGALAMALVALAGQTIHKSNGAPSRLPPDAVAMSSLEIMWDWPCDRKVIAGLDGDHCVFGSDWESSALRGVLWGDSHAEHMAPVLAAAAKEKDISFLLVDNCPAALGKSVHRNWPEVPDFVERCKGRRQDVLNLIQAGSIDILVLSASWHYLPPLVFSDQPLDQTEMVLYGVKELLADVSILHKKPAVILIDQLPTFSQDPILCELETVSGLLRKQRCESNSWDAYKSSTMVQTKSLPGFKSLMSEFDFLQVLTPRELMCIDGACRTEIGGEFIFRDATHLRRNLSEKTLKTLADQIGLSSAIEQAVESSKK